MKNNIKQKTHGIVSKVSDRVGIPFDMLSGMPLIKMMSNREIVVEDAGVLICYNENNVKMSQGKIYICITGRGLKIKCLSNNSISVSGYITSVSFDGGDML